MTDQDVLKNLLKETEHLNLPLPRLQLVWGPAEPEGSRFKQTCYYLLLFPVDQYDCRNFAEEGSKPYTAAVMGETVSTGSRIKGTETPYRDGAHICWDSESLRFPAFVSNGREYRKLKPATPPFPV